MTWNDYLQQTKLSKPRPLLVKALGYVHKKEQALDLGAGAMNDAHFLVSEGFHVVAIDSNPMVAEHVKDENIEVIISEFDAYAFPEEIFDLVSAEYALPFNASDTFNEMFLNLGKSLKIGGIFAGQFFGNEDEWKDDEKMTFHTKAEVDTLLTGFTVHVCNEVKEVRKTAAGDDKFWHVFNVIAEKI
jgi:tellurite methyltransferase